jgi:hypothetical protein
MFRAVFGVEFSCSVFYNPFIMTDYMSCVPCLMVDVVELCT